MVHMVGVDIGDDGNIRVLLEESPIAFIGFGNNIRAFPQDGIAMQVIDFAADDDGRVLMTFFEDLAQHGRRRRLAMGTGYRNPLPPAHDVDQGIGPMDDRNPAAARFGQFYVSIADGRRNDDDLGILQIFRTLADADTGPFFRELFRHRRRFEIRTGYMISFFNENIGNCPHSGAGNADKMNVCNLVQINHRFIPHPSLPVTDDVYGQWTGPVQQYHVPPGACPWSGWPVPSLPAPSDRLLNE